jgi:nucleoside-diphosphate-sugar epimerase
MNILISGINGYLGSLIYEGLRTLYPSSNFYAISSKRSKSDFVEYFQSLNEIPNDKNFDFVFYLSWIGVNGKDKFSEQIQFQNYLNGIYFFNTIKNKAKKVYYFGTIGEYLAKKYGKQEDLLYGYYKNQLHNSILADLPTNLTFSWLQVANVFGKNNLTGNILGTLLKSYLSKQDFKFKTKCNTLYEFIYDKDLMKVLLKLIDLDRIPNTLYLGPGSPKKLSYFINEVNALFNFEKDFSININEDDKYLYDCEAFDNSKLLKLLNHDFMFTKFSDALMTVKQGVENDKSVK